ncbi:serine hydrolase [Demequina sp. NBRC 110051]|uniref:serine hydrolase domain-containing protein n=1 Tax=Demequina sp. NBRC 110051 TaxID=1570340 RepID=UPI0009FEB111|nr:serine hydrolase domain-containing protein [Demequina sp. NBRC 110051]
MEADLDAVCALLPRRHDRVLVAVARGDESAWRAFGVDEGADAEVGSVAKGLTGMLYASALASRDVRTDTRLGDLLDLESSPAAEVTLGSLSTHTSGLPRLGPTVEGPSALARQWALWRKGANPYGEDIDGLLAEARAASVGKAKFRYSNLGFSLLGHAVAAALGMGYPAALRSRVLEPLEMADTYVARSESDLRPRALRGASRRGRAQSPWVGAGIAPAGGVRVTARDLGALVGALARVGTADAGVVPGGLPVDPLAVPPGMGAWAGALVPVATVGKRGPAASRIGAAWMTSEVRGRQVTWHNGRTGGFASFVGVDRAAGVAVGIVSACAAGVDHQGFVALEALRGG